MAAVVVVHVVVVVVAAVVAVVVLAVVVAVAVAVVVLAVAVGSQVVAVVDLALRVVVVAVVEADTECLSLSMWMPCVLVVCSLACQYWQTLGQCHAQGGAVTAMTQSVAHANTTASTSSPGGNSKGVYKSHVTTTEARNGSASHNGRG